MGSAFLDTEGFQQAWTTAGLATPLLLYDWDGLAAEKEFWRAFG
jgi:hypothetical protein